MSSGHVGILENVKPSDAVLKDWKVMPKRVKSYPYYLPEILPDVNYQQITLNIFFS